MNATCETCRWWGEGFTSAPATANEHRLCHWPAPPYLHKQWASPRDLDTCVVHQPKEPTP